jgi:hypothetical protein
MKEEANREHHLLPTLFLPFKKLRSKRLRKRYSTTFLPIRKQRCPWCRTARILAVRRPRSGDGGPSARCFLEAWPTKVAMANGTHSGGQRPRLTQLWRTPAVLPGTHPCGVPAPHRGSCPEQPRPCLLHGARVRDAASGPRPPAGQASVGGRSPGSHRHGGASGRDLPRRRRIPQGSGRRPRGAAAPASPCPHRRPCRGLLCRSRRRRRRGPPCRDPASAAWHGLVSAARPCLRR